MSRKKMHWHCNTFLKLDHIETKSAGFSAVVCHEDPGLSMVCRPLAPGIHSLMVRPPGRGMIGRRTVDVVRVVKIGRMWIIMVLVIVPMPVVMRNMTESLAGQLVTIIVIVPTWILIDVFIHPCCLFRR